MNYQIGGTLRVTSPIYVFRQADSQIYEALKRGEFCYIFNSRQMGKSSLLVKTKYRLQIDVSHDQPLLSDEAGTETKHCCQQIATTGIDQTIKLWKADGTLINTLVGHEGAVWDVRFSPDNRSLVSGSGDRTLKLWNLDESSLKTLSGHNASVYAVNAENSVVIAKEKKR